MDYFAIQVWTGHEDEYVRRLSATPCFKDSALIVPKRSMPLRKRGVLRTIQKPLFSGYVFIPTEDDTLSPEQRWYIKTTAYYVRILPDAANPQPIGTRDRAVLSHFISFGKSADTSKVIFDEHDRIVVLEGPLKGLEGMIVKVDKRKMRAKVRLDLCQDSFRVDLAFEVMERPAKGSEASNEST
jgi:transcription termination/antitermination protein NusG